MKYLLLVPIRNSAHLLPFFFQSLRSMNPKPDYIVWCTNNNTDKTVQKLKAFRDIPSEIIELPDFPRDFVKQHGIYEAMGIVRQRLWERARELNSEWTFTCDVDHFVISTDILNILSDWSIDYVVTPQMRFVENAQKKGEYAIILTAWLLENGNWCRVFSDFYTHALIPHQLFVCRSTLTPQRPLLVPNMAVAYGFYCFSRRLVQDCRLNWHPLSDSTATKDLPIGEFLVLARNGLVGKNGMIGEDMQFALSARRLGYIIHMDG